MNNIFEMLMVERFNLLTLIIVALVVSVMTFYGCVCGIKDLKRKEELLKKTVVDESHKTAMNYTPAPAKADAEECRNALSYLENLNVSNTSTDRKA